MQGESSASFEGILTVTIIGGKGTASQNAGNAIGISATEKNLIRKSSLTLEESSNIALTVDAGDPNTGNAGVAQGIVVANHMLTLSGKTNSSLNLKIGSQNKSASAVGISLESDVANKSTSLTLSGIGITFDDKNSILGSKDSGNTTNAILIHNIKGDNTLSGKIKAQAINGQNKYVIKNDDGVLSLGSTTNPNNTEIIIGVLGNGSATSTSSNSGSGLLGSIVSGVASFFSSSQTD